MVMDGPVDRAVERLQGRDDEHDAPARDEHLAHRAQRAGGRPAMCSRTFEQTTVSKRLARDAVVGELGEVETADLDVRVVGERAAQELDVFRVDVGREHVLARRRGNGS